MVVLRPKWGAMLLGLGLLGVLAMAFVPEENAAEIIGLGAFSLLLLAVGAWALLMRRQYHAVSKPASSTRSRKILIGLDDPVYMKLVTLDLELDEDYALADAFEFIQGMRSVCRQLRGLVVVGA